MSKFTGNVALLFSDDTTWAMLIEDLHWECDYKGSEALVVIPKHFETDGATLPWYLWWLMPPWGSRYTRAVILHDYLLLCLDNKVPVAGMDTREKCDWQFYLALKALGANEVRARALWIGVRSHSIAYEKGWVHAYEQRTR